MVYSFPVVQKSIFNHKILLVNSDKLGIRGICFDLFKSYLSENPGEWGAKLRKMY